MGTISTTALTTVLDSIASGKLIFDAAEGTTGAQPNTVAKAAANDQATLSAINDADVQADLAPVFRLRAAGLLASALYSALQAFNAWWALDKHVGGLELFLVTNNIRVSPALVAVGFPLSAECILPPAVDPMATFDVTSSGAGTYTHVADVDTAQYGRAWVDLVVTATIGAQDIVATVTGKQFDGVTVTAKQATIAANSSIGTVVHVGTLGTQADSYDSITGISIAGGSSGDAFKVVSRVERTISATS